MKKIACIGSLSVDYYVTQQKYFAGGHSLSLANNFRSLGLTADLYSGTGNDFFGQAVYHFLQTNSELADNVIKITGQTTVRRILLAANGESQLDTSKPGVIDNFSKEWSPSADHFNKHELIHLQLAEGIESLFDKISYMEFAGVKALNFALDTSVRYGLNNTLPRYCQKFDIIFLAIPEDQLSFIQSLAMANPKKTFVAFSSKDQVHCFRGEENIALNFPVANLKDTTGREAAFQAGFLANWLKAPKDLKMSLKFGIHNSIEIMGHIGGTDLEMTTLS